MISGWITEDTGVTRPADGEGSSKDTPKRLQEITWMFAVERDAK